MGGGLRSPNVKFKTWATKMLSLHEPTWQKAGILEAVAASTLKICKEPDLVMGIAERWCPDTNTFVFPLGEATITLEDVMVLLGFSVLGSPVFTTLDGSGKRTKEKLEKERVVLQKGQGRMVTQAGWMMRFMDNSGDDDEIEHAAFLALWLSYFVFPSRYYQINEAVFPVAVHLSRGTKIALAPAVLAHLYADLTLLKDHIRGFGFGFKTVTSNEKVELTSLFKLVQVWTWERFGELRPNNTNPLLQGEPRLALWDEPIQKRITKRHVRMRAKRDVREILSNSKMDSFEWRPYTKAVRNWEFPKFYPEKAMWVPVGPDLDEELISFARCIKVSDLVGMDSVKHYFPNRVATQFGLLQDVPCPVKRNSLSREAAWDEYNKPIDDLTLFIPSRSTTPRVTPTFCDWWKVSFPQLQRSLNEKCVVESSETLKSRNIIGDLGPKKRKRRTRENNDEGDASESLCKKCRLASVRADVDKPVTPPEREQRKETEETGSKAGKRVVLSQCDETNPSHPPLAFVGAMGTVVSPVETTKSCDDDKIDVCGSSEEKMSLIDYVSKETEFSLHEDGAIAGEKESSESLIQIKQRNEGNDDETGSRTGKNMVRSPNDDIHVSPPPETRQVFDDELDVQFDGNKEPECLLHEDGGMAEVKASSEKKEDNSMIQRKIASNADDNEQTLCQNLATGGFEIHGESNTGNAVGGETQGHDCLFHDTVLGSEEPMNASEQLEKRNEDVGGSDSHEKSLHNAKELASSIEERIAKAQRNVAWLKAAKQRKIAAGACLI
ncbi:Plant mobile domain protein family [Raphanus sativus]|nr:Plant mobile domain protein family [Raphanus sativus]